MDNKQHQSLKESIKSVFLGENWDTYRGAEHHDPDIAHAALRDPRADAITVNNAAQHPDPSVVLAALRHSNVTWHAVVSAEKHADPNVVAAAQAHDLHPNNGFSG